MDRKLTATSVSKRRIRLTGPCVVTGKLYSVVVEKEAATNYFKLGMKIHEAFPNLSLEEREFLISGISPEGWNKTFLQEAEQQTS
jgi:hypothetical protein